MAKRRKPENAVCHKNDILTLEIVDMGNEGEGVARVEGYTLFVKDALTGDVIRGKVIKTRRNFGYVRLLEILTPSPFRVEPECPVARQCGGCQLQHCSYEKQLAWKEEKIANCLNRIGGQAVSTPRGTVKSERGSTVVMESIIGMEYPGHYRNKAQFPVGVNREGRLIAGFYAGRTHQIVESRDCMIQHPCSQILVDAVLKYMEVCQVPSYDETEHTGLMRHILIRVGVNTGQVMLCLVINGEKIPQAEQLVEMVLEQKLEAAGQVPETNSADRQRNHAADCDDPVRHDDEVGGDVPALHIVSICLNHNRDKTNVILGDRVSMLYGNEYIEDRIGDITYRISPLSFYQVNPLQTKRLYETALDYAGLTGREVVWDLYCGIGTISLFLAKRAKKVCGVEIVPQAVEDARENARINGIENAEFFAGAAEDVVPAEYERSRGTLRADVVVVDPPRRGCEEGLLATVVRMEPDRIVYVSCDPATLARDVKYLCGSGYELARVRGCDMFGMGYHVESVCLLHRK